MRCAYCGGYTPTQICVVCGDTKPKCTCAQPVVINGQDFTPNRNTECPVHPGDVVVENPLAPDHPTTADLEAQNAAKIGQASMGFMSEKEGN